MKKILMLSGPDKTKYFSEEITNCIKENVDNPINMVVIPTDPDNFSKNDRHFNGNENTIGVVKTFKKIFPKLNLVLLDSKINVHDGINLLKQADIIYLLGGNPFKQLDYLRQTKYDEIVKNSNALIIGVSAGTMNLAIKSYYSKDDDYPESVIYNGLGIVDVTIDPHFDINNVEQLNEIKINSKKIKIIGLPNELAIVISDDKLKYIGIAYVFEDGKLISIINNKVEGVNL